MINESLKTILGEDLVKQIETKIGTLDEEAKGKLNIANVGDGSYMPRAKYNALNDSVEDFKKQIADRDTQLEDLKKANKGNEDLVAKIKTLQDENATIKTDYEAKLEAQARSTAISEAISGAKAKNVKTILPLLDDSKIIYKDGKLVGVDEQLKALKEAEDSSFLFEATPQHNKGFNPGKTGEAPQNTNESMNSLIRGGLGTSL